MKLKCLAGALALALLAGGALAADLPSGGSMTIAEVNAWLQSKGYTTRIVANAQDGDHIEVISAQPRFIVDLFDCKQERCGSLEFKAGFDMHGKFRPGDVNGWNQDKRWGKAYTDAQNDPWLAMDVDTSPGGAYELLNDELDVWNEMLPEFAKYINNTD
jgi:putative sensory transduction regulator